MDDKQRSEINRRLIRDYGFKEAGGYLNDGQCPHCKKRSLWISASDASIVSCNHRNNCGFQTNVRDLYPEVFASWSTRFPIQHDAPNATADAYLTDARGFDLGRIKGLYTQENFYDPKRRIGSATVRFALPGGSSWERLIDEPERFGDQKANFRGGYKGQWWAKPGVNLRDAAEIWIVEGIFDAIALDHHGVVAVSVLSCVNYPDIALTALREATAGRSVPKLVWALDSDKAGSKATQKFWADSRKDGWEAAAAQIPAEGRKKLDWNDLHRAGRLSAKDLDLYRHHGALLVAPSAAAKAALIYSSSGREQFHFIHGNATHWFKLDLDAFGKAKDRIAKEEPGLDEDELRAAAIKESGKVSEICTRALNWLYFMRSVSTDESWYYARIESSHSPAVKDTFTSGQIASSGEFKRRLLHISPGALWTGTDRHLDAIVKSLDGKIKNIETIEWIGYSPEHKAYIFPKVAVQNGRVHAINDEDYFELGKTSIKTLSRSIKLDIDGDASHYKEEWFRLLTTCFGTRGLVALAYWLGSLFAEQVRSESESWPFLEIVGEPGAGKTTLIETLWRLLGRGSYEGFDPMKGSQVGFLRSMEQISNLPVVLIESDRSSEGESGRGRPKGGFHWDSLKSLYNGGALRTTGVKSSGNDTRDPKFRGALVISQNAEVQASTAVMERLVHLYFDKAEQTVEGRDAALALRRLSALEMSGFLVKALAKEGEILANLAERTRMYERGIEAAGVRNPRIQKNHAQVMFFVDALSLITPVSKTQQAEARDAIVDMAVARERALSLDHPVVEEFWEAVEFIGLDQLNHSSDPQLVAININHFTQLAIERRQQIPLLSDLKRVLKASVRRQFIEVKTVHSQINRRINDRSGAVDSKLPQNVKCWVFKAK